MSINDAISAVLKLNPHPRCHARARWLPDKQTWDFPMFKTPLTKDLAAAHVRGEVLIGGVASDEEGYTTSVGLDLDAHLADQKPASAARRFAHVARTLGIPVIMHTSKSGKGAHIRTLFKDRVPTHLARALYISLVVASGLSAHKAIDKVWPPTHGLGVLALPYNGKLAKSCGGTVAVDTWTLRPLHKSDQVACVLDGQEMDREDLETALVAMRVRTEDEARLLSGIGPKGPVNAGSRKIKDQEDGGLQHMVNLCEAVKLLGDNATGVSYDFWFSMMTNFRPFIGGKEVFEEYSRLDPNRYDARHLERTWRAITGGPRRCENLDPMWRCPRMGVCPARSPAGLPFAVRRIEREREAREQQAG